MTESLSFWWRARSPRERGLLTVMAALAAIVLGWLLVVQPLSDALDAQKARHGAAVIALAEARARLETGGAPAGAVTALPVDSLIGQAAAEAGFAGARITAQGPARAIVAIDAARPQAMFGWLVRLERSGLIVERLRAQANSDRTLGVEASLRARGR
ncbi:MAG TPA: type II secretion system protein GspM [Allosphingosinicella sp.]|nr:type II secretion system protein GspM [Allosphingosinicella sp.]